MLEGLAAWVLNNYIGEYVEDLNTHQLSIGVFQGQVELENLPLKKDALKKLDLPLEVRSGFIGKILLSIPVKRLRSEPWVITLEKLYLVAGPLTKQQYNEEEEKKQQNITKQAQLKALEDKWKTDQGSYTSSMWSITPMMTNVLENIQLKVKDVHIRYEDDQTIPGSSFACGVTIKSLSAQSTDGSWLPKFVSRYDTDMMRKLVDLQEFSVYWDTDSARVGNLSRSEMEDALQRPMGQSAKTGEFTEHEYLLDSVSAQAKMKRNTSALPLRNPNTPRISFDIQLEKIPMSLSEAQYRGMVCWMKEFKRHEKKRKYRRWKPMCKVKDNRKAWWNYAIESNLHNIMDRNKRRTVEFITQRCRDNVKYVDAYIDFIAIGTAYMEPELKAHMDRMEEELMFEELKILREIGREKMTSSAAPPSKKQKFDPIKDGTSAPEQPSPVSSSSTASKKTDSKKSPTEPAKSPTSPSDAPQSQGLFQRWFPGWGGWGGTAATTATSPTSVEGILEQLAGDEDLGERVAADQKFEQEVYDMLNDTAENNTLLRRDIVFAQLNFELQSGKFQLLHENASSGSSSSRKSVLLEMECSHISIDFESRPRTNGMKFGIKLGGLYLRDKMTPDSIMPVLIAPQQRDRSTGHGRQLFSGVLGRSPAPLHSMLTGGAPLLQNSDQALFELVYEKKPAQTKADYRLDIKTKPLDIVYNPTTISRVKDFFVDKNSIQSEIELAVAAKSRYEAIKKQTEQELKQTIDDLLEGDEKIKAKRWNFNMDISAPQIIVPQNFSEPNTTLVVFDLGHLLFHNMDAGIKDDIKTEDEDEEDFVTPSSSPPAEMEETPAAEQSEQSNMISEIFSKDLSEAAIREKIYDKYTLNLSELQVMVGRAKDNWRFAHSKGTSHLHVVDKFSISVQFDRRLLYTSDPQWPKASVSGTLPNLTLHFNEQKIQALRSCATLLSEPAAASPSDSSPLITDPHDRPRAKLDQSMYYSVYQAYSKSIQGTQSSEDQQAKQQVAESVLVLMQFSINQVSLEIQSRGRSVAELQVSNVNTNLTKRPYDTSVNFCIHSLLVVDALQTYGQDFELLVASHKNLCMDTQSGSMMDSDPSSPCSPQSPLSPSSPAEPDKPSPAVTRGNVPAAVSNALQSLVISNKSLLLSPDITPNISPTTSLNMPRYPTEFQPPPFSHQSSSSNALIKVELDIISPSCPSNTTGDDTLHMANIQFNNLDFIANQQTLVELVGFFQRVLPSDKKKAKKKSEQLIKPDEEKPAKPETSGRYELSAEFHRLNVLLMRVEKGRGRKVATATMAEAKIDVTMVLGDLEVEASVGGLQFQNLTPEVRTHKKVLSIGTDPLGQDLNTSTTYLRTDMYQTAQEASLFLDDSTSKAFVCTLSKPGGRNPKSPPYSPGFDGSPGSKAGKDEVALRLRMASLWYTHSPDLLKEISLCMTEFKDYMTDVGSSIKTAATEMAIGFVNQRTDLLGASFYGSNMSLDGSGATPASGRSQGKTVPSMSELAMDGGLDSFTRSVDETAAEDSSYSTFKLDIHMQTPVVLLPRKRDSPEVLVAHLGKIHVRNFDQPNKSEADSAENRDQIYVEVRDMSVYSTDLDKQKLLKDQATSSASNLNTSVFHMPQPGGYVQQSYGTPILHDTMLELTLEKQSLNEYFANQSVEMDPLMKDCEKLDLNSNVIQVSGRVISPLKLALSKHVYEQILQTVDNITPEDDDPVISVNKQSSPDITTQDVPLQDISEDMELDLKPGVSALKLDIDLNESLNQSFSREQSVPSSTTTNITETESQTILRANFEMPVFSVEMTGDLGEGVEKGLVDLRLEDFRIHYQKNDPWAKTIDLSLQSLLIEDLLQDKNSKHRYLMVSTQKPRPPEESAGSRMHLSQSCPTSMIDLPMPNLPPSLPTSFRQDNVFEANESALPGTKSSVRRLKSTSDCPVTPPPSRLDSRRQSFGDDDRLVHINMTLVDRKCPDFKTKYKSTNRFIDVDFNGLDTTINLQTWVVLLDFLGMGAKVHDLEDFRQSSQTSLSTAASGLSTPRGKGQEEVMNSEVDLKVQSLSLVLNKKEYELARATISRFDSHVSLHDGNFAIKGQLGSMSLTDQSPHGAMYRERLMTTGSQAVDFDIFKYGTPDPDLLRPHDISVKLRMLSVRYIHTQRFLQETLAFCQNFNQLQDILGRSRAASAGMKIAETAFRSSRIAMDVEAGAPIILIPHSSKSTDILVMDLGTLSVHNTFLMAGDEGTISFKRGKKRSNSVSTLRGPSSVSGLSDVTFHSCQSNAEASVASFQTAAESHQASMMDSIYGSLEGDWRGDSGSDTTSVASASSSKLDSKSSGQDSLAGFYSAMGGSVPSSSIGASRPMERPPRDERRATSSSVSSTDRTFESVMSFPGLTFEEAPHVCLLDVWGVELLDMDLFSAEWKSKDEYKRENPADDLVFSSFVAQRELGKLLKNKCRLTLQVERNLEGDISHNEPDFSIDGKLTSVDFQLDLKQYQLIRGLLAHNFGENLESFQRPMMSQLQDPRIHTVLSGDVWIGISIMLDLDGVSAELLIAHGNEADNCPEASLAKFDFITSRLSFESKSDGTKDVDLVSHEIKLFDTRYRDNPVNVRPNVFPEILKPSFNQAHPQALQMELHFRSSKDLMQFTVLLNSMRVMGIFDWLLTCKDFLLTSPEDPYKQAESEVQDNSQPELQRQDSAASTVSQGIITKRGDTLEQKKETFELRLNVTDTELVVVEDTTDRDTNAVILKSTAVFTYKPSSDRPVSCSLQSLEVFSCSLAAEDDTALSIIDPMGINIELNRSTTKTQRTIGPGGLLDAASASSQPPILEISFLTLNVRLSYNDMKLFLAILKTMPKQMLQASKNTPAPPKNAIQCRYPVEQVKKLENLGFERADCERALIDSDGRLDEAALWLTQNATPVTPTGKPSGDSQQNGGLSLSGFEVKADCICLCLIDDCLDADVPLAELTFANFNFLHKFSTIGKGKAEFKLSGDYYNRMLSGWEPFIESWGCLVKWSQDSMEENKLNCSVIANSVLNINITSTLMDQYSKTKSKWTKDYYDQENMQVHEDGTHNGRKRVAFIPYTIRNHTGCKLWFATMTTTPTKVSGEQSPKAAREEKGQYKISGWTEVREGSERAFLFEEREKIRHQHTHKLKVHQLVVQVEGWREVSAVSVDKVGTYFRSARPEVNPTTSCAQPMALVVFDVGLEGSARKVITVRSGLMLHNRLEDDVEIRLENTLAVSPVSPGQDRPIVVPSGAKQAMPLPLVHSRMWIRPQGWSLDWCQKPVLWQQVTKAAEYNDSINHCNMAVFAEKDTYRFCVSTYRQHFPPSPGSPTSGQTSPKQGPIYSQPGHIITLMPPVRLENLLPIDMTYQIRTSASANIKGTIKPGKTAALVVADLTQTLELSISLDNFTTCKELVIPPGTLDYKVKLVLSDRENDRPLELTVRIKAGIGGSLKLSVSAPYWLVNKTGLPLIFKQDGAKTTAGQFEEHELARSVTPLLFSYTEKDKSYMCQMRLGKYVHGVKSMAQWCHRFSLERGSGVRELHITPPDNRPDWVYMIGIEVRQGRGRYVDTNIITFSPRYQLDNRSSHKLAFAQRYAVEKWSPSSVDYFSALPNCTLSFHWPRVDKDMLLCVKPMDETDSHWTGGFRIDRVQSFHVNIRAVDNKSTFLRVDIILQGATFFVVFSDADHMPPPYRIQNFSEVPVIFYQTQTKDDRLRTTLRPMTQVPYALDEPILPPHLTVKVMGGSAATYNMNNIKDGDQLYYENHIYLAFTGTFSKYRREGAMSSSWAGMGSYMEMELVLDVLSNGRVILKKKEAGKRSQLWRMTSTGMLQHEGSAVPRDPRKATSSASSVSYVLDIQDIALQPGREMALTIRKADERRKSTQTWMFTRDGRLCCGGRTNLCVQSKGGFFGLRDGEEAILGPSLPTLRSKHDVPIEMAVHNEKSRPGSGQLSIKVLTDGPTRVLRITDVTQQRLQTSQVENWVVVEDEKSLPALTEAEEQKLARKSRELEVNIDLPEGIGVSLVNKKYEELIYMSMKEIRVHYYSTSLGQDLDVIVHKFQIDNQLVGRYHPVLLYVTPHARGDDEEDKGPALQISVNKVANSKWNADIYKHLAVVMKRLTLQMEETLLWKLLQFFGVKQSDTEVENLTETGIDSHNELSAATASHLKRYYFGTLKVDIHRSMLSVLTASDLSPDLRLLKRAFGIPLVKFADAQVDLEPFVRHHLFETSAFLMESIQFHFTEELKSQAASILGSVDFLGNPLGFFNDVAEGVSGLLEGNVGGLFKNVTHGVSNSAAKVTGSLSDGLGVATLDDQHQKIRQQIRYDSQGHGTSAGSGHLVAGIKGLGHGLFGGLTSIVSQTYTGAKSEGFEGFFTGLGKGMVGTVTKPVAGVLDFASGAASAVRDTSRSSSKVEPRRVRRSRVTRGAGGLLPAYSDELAQGQEHLFKQDNRSDNEVCIAMEMLRAGREDSLRVLISTGHVYFLGKSPRDKETVILDPTYDELIHCRAVTWEKNKHYLELTIKAETDRALAGSQEARKAPLVRCDQESVAQRVAQQINYAKVLYEEVKHTLPPDVGREDD